MQLVTHLYKDHLLEEEHFLDWVLKNLDSCPQERLFLWLLLVSIYWQDLTSSRRRSKRLAESLLNHAEKVRANPSVTSNHFLTSLYSYMGLTNKVNPLLFLDSLKKPLSGSSIPTQYLFSFPKRGISTAAYFTHSLSDVLFRR